MNQSLFSITSELQDIILQLEEGEATDELIEQLGITENNLKEKIGTYLNVIHKYDNDVTECKNEITRIQGIQKTRNNTVARLKSLVLDAVLMFGSTGKSGNKVIEGPTYKVFSRQTETVDINTPYVADIITNFVSIVTEYLSSVDKHDTLDLDYLANLISHYINNAKKTYTPTHEDIEFNGDDKHEEIQVTKDDLIALSVEVTINLRLCDLAKAENYDLAAWIGRNPHNVSIAPKVTKTALKEHIAMNADLTICKKEVSTSLIIK